MQLAVQQSNSLKCTAAGRLCQGCGCAASGQQAVSCVRVIDVLQLDSRVECQLCQDHGCAAAGQQAVSCIRTAGVLQLGSGCQLCQGHGTLGLKMLSFFIVKHKLNVSQEN